MLTIQEKLVQFRTDDQGIGQVAKKTEGDGVMYLVGHLYPAGYIPEMMLMMPKAVGAAALFIGKRMSRLYLGDLGKPTRSHPTQGPKLIFDELPGENSIPFRGRKNDKFHLGWRDDGKIGWIGEKRPDFIEGSRDELDAV